MRWPWIFLASALVGCGDNRTPADASERIGCRAIFAGNFDETSTSQAGCATIAPAGAATVLALSVSARALDAPLAIEIDLGQHPPTGQYSSVTVQRWSARATRGNKACLYVGGTDLARRGSFTLALNAIDLAGSVHGDLVLDLPVLQTPFQVCGATLTEAVKVEF